MATFTNRIRALSLLFIFVALVLIVKLYVVQVIDNQTYLDLGDRQYVSKSSNINARGDIYFTKRDGTYVVAATMKDNFTLYINPKSFFTSVQSSANTAHKTEDQSLADLRSTLITALKLDKDKTLDLDAKMAKIKDKRADVYFELVKDLGDDDQTAIQALKLSYLGLGKEKKRSYPGNELASNVIGTVGFQGNDIAGRYGLEKQFDSTLVRTSQAYSNFFVDLFDGAKKVITDRQNLEGDVYTTIEPVVQKELEKKLLAVNSAQSSQLTGGIIMDPYTGEIVAMAKVPTFGHDDQNYPIADYKNDLVESTYEMGSIIKSLTMSMGIDAGKVHRDTTYFDAGFVKVADRTIKNFDNKGRGTITMQYALAQSLNTGFVYIARLVGNELMTKYFYSFGVGEKTGIDLPNESSPLTDNLKKGDVEHATISFGQGIALTPVGVIRSLALIANGGYLVNPHVVSKIKYTTIGDTKVTPVLDLTKETPVLKASTIQEIRDMLVSDVDTTLLQGKRKNPHYTIAAKTGTAQVASQNGGYVEGENIHTFIGFFPAYHPKFIVFLYTVDPKKAQYASEDLAAPFLDLSDFLIQYYEIPADR